VEFYSLYGIIRLQDMFFAVKRVVVLTLDEQHQKARTASQAHTYVLTLRRENRNGTVGEMGTGNKHAKRIYNGEIK